MKQIIFFTLIFIACLALTNCGERYHMTACFTVNKTTAHVGDTLTFSNCSDYDGATPENVSWFFGDGDIIYNSPVKTITHIYKSAGNYKAEISIGGAEQGDHKECSITIE